MTKGSPFLKSAPFDREGGEYFSKSELPFLEAIIQNIAT